MVRAMHIVSLEVREMLERRLFRELKEALQGLYPSDLLDIMQDLEPENRALLFRLLPKDKAADVFAEMYPEEQEDLLNRLTDEKVAELLKSMAPDDRTELLEEMPASVVARLIRLLSPEERRQALTLLNYPANSAGRIMTPDYVAVRPRMRVQEVLDRIRRVEFDKETIYYIYVIDEERRLVGVLSLRELLLAEPSEFIETLMNRDVIAVRTTDDQETVVRLMKRYDLLALPVVDAEDRLVGIVTIDDAMDVLEEEATEDIYKLSALEGSEIDYARARPVELYKKRIAWLTLLFVSESLTSTVIARYEHLIARLAILAAWIPLLIGTGGNVGSQVTTLIVRAFATGQIRLGDFLRVLWKEVRVGLLIGVSMGLYMWLRITVFRHEPLIALSVGIAMVLIALAANLVGVLLPFLFRRLGVDPAVTSSPFIATLMDVTGLLIYFNVVQWLLRDLLHGGGSP
jgi:magnesium transporter